MEGQSRDELTPADKPKAVKVSAKDMGERLKSGAEFYAFQPYDKIPPDHLKRSGEDDDG